MSNTSENLERTQRFDHWVARVDRALHDTEIAIQLGRLGTALLKANDAAFLPNVRGSRVMVPKAQQTVDSIAILPELPTDGALRPHPTLLQPTPYREGLMEYQLAQASLSKKRGVRVAHLVRQALKHTRTEASELLHFIDDLPVHTSAVRHDFEQPASITFSSRPIVSIESRRSYVVPDALKAAMGAQSLVSALDSDMLQQPMDKFVAHRTELRGNYVSAVILRRALETGELSESARQNYEYITDVFDIEKLRELFAIGTNELMIDEPVIDERFKLLTRAIENSYYYSHPS